MLGYAPKAVTATATVVTVTSNTYGISTKRSTIDLAPGSSTTASVTISA